MHFLFSSILGDYIRMEKIYRSTNDHISLKLIFLVLVPIKSFASWLESVIKNINSCSNSCSNFISSLTSQKQLPKVQSGLYLGECSFHHDFFFYFGYLRVKEQSKRKWLLHHWMVSLFPPTWPSQSKTQAECKFTLRFGAFTALASFAMLLLYIQKSQQILRETQKQHHGQGGQELQSVLQFSRSKGMAWNA